MRGNRKLLVILLYLAAVTAVAMAVVTYHYDTLAGAGLWAGGAATGIGTFIWGNAQEHKAEAEKAKAQAAAAGKE